LTLLTGKAGKRCADSDFLRVVRVGGGTVPAEMLAGGRLRILIAWRKL